MPSEKRERGGMNRAGISLTTTKTVMMTTTRRGGESSRESKVVANRDRAIYAMQGALLIRRLHREGGEGGGHADKVREVA